MAKRYPAKLNSFHHLLQCFANASISWFYYSGLKETDSTKTWHKHMKRFERKLMKKYRKAKHAKR